jgi:hypothetical protein
MFHEIDELLFSLMPQVERYEGRVRFSPSSMQEEGDGQEMEPPPEEPEVKAEASE